MAYKTVPSPPYPDGHACSQIHGDGQRTTKRRTPRKWRCPRVGEDGETCQHCFCTSDVGGTTRAAGPGGAHAKLWARRAWELAHGHEGHLCDGC